LAAAHDQTLFWDPCQATYLHFVQLTKKKSKNAVAKCETEKGEYPLQWRGILVRFNKRRGVRDDAHRKHSLPLKMQRTAHSCNARFPTRHLAGNVIIGGATVIATQHITALNV
jgi:hypothetical protein